MPPDPPPPTPAPGRRGRLAPAAGLAAVLVWILAWLLVDLDRPWTGSHDDNGAMWSQSARNHLRAGLGTTYGVPACRHWGPPPIAPGGYYTHHPPGVSLLVAASFASLGESESSARVVPIAAALATTVLLYLLVARAPGPRAGVLAAAVLSLLPMHLYFGRMVNMEPVALPAVLAALVALQAWEERRTRGLAVLVLASLLAAMWVGWFGYIAAGALAAALFVRGGRERRILAVTIAGLGLASFALFAAHISLVRPDAIEELWKAYLFRAGSDVEQGAAAPAFGWGDWASRQWRYLAGHIGPAWVLAASGAGVAWRQRADATIRALGTVAAVLLAASVVNHLAFRNGSYVHNFWGYFLVAPVALLGGVALERLLVLGAARGPSGKRAAWAAVASVFVVLGAYSWRETRRLQAYQYWILARGAEEPPDLIAELGRAIDRAAPESAHVLTNLPKRGPHLRYYADRRITYDLRDPAEWNAELARRRDAAGLVWQGEPGAEQLLAAIGGLCEDVAFGPQRFCLWRSGR